MFNFKTIRKLTNLGPLILLYYLSVSEIDTHFENYFEILSFNILTTSLCKKNNATIIFRGLRAASDFEYEFQLAGMNRQLDKKIETVFLMSDPDKQVISSKFVKEIAKLDGKIEDFVTKSTILALKEKYD